MMRTTRSLGFALAIAIALIGVSAADAPDPPKVLTIDAPPTLYKYAAPAPAAELAIAHQVVHDVLSSVDAPSKAPSSEFTANPATPAAQLDLRSTDAFAWSNFDEGESGTSLERFERLSLGVNRSSPSITSRPPLVSS